MRGSTDCCCFAWTGLVGDASPYAAMCSGLRPVRIRRYPLCGEIPATPLVCETFRGSLPPLSLAPLFAPPSVFATSAPLLKVRRRDKAIAIP